MDKLENPYELINDYEKLLKGLDRVKWKVKCFFDDIYVWIICLYIKLFK